MTDFLMSKYSRFILIFFLISNCSLFSQQKTFGVNLLSSYTNKSYNGGFGVNLFLSLSSNNKISFKPSVGIYFAEKTSNAFELKSSGQIWFTWVSLAAFYNIDINGSKLYTGCGLGYYNPSNHVDGNSRSLETNYTITYGDFSSSIGFSFITGYILKPVKEKGIKPFFEFEYLILNPSYKYSIYNLAQLQNQSINTKFNLNTLLIKFGIEF